MTIVLRSVKGSALSNSQIDGNFSDLDGRVSNALTNISQINTEVDALPVTQTYTWNTRPNYSTTTAGTIINISDVGGAAGSLWRATVAGWVPLNGVVKLASKWGTVAAPVATIAGATGGAFDLSAGEGSVVIPATMLIPGHSLLRVRALYHRRGATANAVARMYLGTSGTNADSLIFALNFAGDLKQVRPDVEAGAITTSSMTATSYLAPGGTGTNVIYAMATNINTSAEMTLSIYIEEGNVADSFDLVSYSVALESL